MTERMNITRNKDTKSHAITIKYTIKRYPTLKEHLVVQGLMAGKRKESY